MWKQGLKVFKDSWNYDTFKEVEELKRDLDEGQKDPLPVLPLPDGFMATKPLNGTYEHREAVDETLWRLGKDNTFRPNV